LVEETRKRETWLQPAVEREGRPPAEADRLLASAAILRGVAESIPIPEEAEERSRAGAVAYMQELRAERNRNSNPRAPWYLRAGSLMRFVFTLGRRR
jgi:hypothetical protein